MKFTLLISLVLISNICFSQSYKYAHFCKEKLSSKEFRGRGYQENGDKISANFISNELNKFGLKSYYESYYQYFDININNIIDAKLEIGGLYQKKIIGQDFLVYGSSPITNLLIENEKPIRINKELIKNYKNFNSLDNKIILLDIKSISAYQISVFIRDINKYNVIPKLIIIQNYDKIPFYSGRNVFLFPILQLKGEVFKNKIKYLNLIINSKFEENYKTQNIIAYVEGNTFKDSLFVFTAHYDHLGMIGENCYFPGANDNASGVAMLLDLAKYYSENSSDYGIVFIFTSAEEIGLNGSRYISENPPFNLSKVKFLFNLDMVGTGSGGISIINGINESRASSLINEINFENKYFNQIKIGNASCNSDHCPFVDKGVPGVFIFTFGCEYNEYHTIYDDGVNLPFTKHVDLCNLLKIFIDKY